MMWIIPNIGTVLNMAWNKQDILYNKKGIHSSRLHLGSRHCNSTNEILLLCEVVYFIKRGKIGKWSNNDLFEY